MADSKGEKRQRSTEQRVERDGEERVSDVPAFRCPCGDPLLAPLRTLLEPMLSRAREGQLSHAEATELVSGSHASRLLAFEDTHHAATLSRALFQQAVSWAIFSEEWLDAFANLLRHHGRTRVLEVAAGAGVLAEPMRRRGLDWRTTDQSPAHIGLPAEQTPVACNGMAALARFGHEADLLFWSWWPARDAGDAELADECARRGLPAIFVGEGPGGITGSAALWERASVQPLSGLGAVDVPRWLDMQGRTWVVDASLLTVVKRKGTGSGTA